MSNWNEMLGNEEELWKILNKAKDEGEQLVPVYGDDEVSVAVSITYEKYKEKNNFVITLDVRDNSDGESIPLGLTVMLEGDGFLDDDSFLTTMVRAIVRKSREAFELRKT